MFPINKPNYQVPRLIISFCWYLQQHRVIPEILCLHKIDAVFCTIGFTLCGVKFEGIHSIETIP